MLSSRKFFFLSGSVYLLFVVYGSLVPLDFHPRPFDEAVRNFLHIRYLRLGMESRADWVANILLYIPLPYLWLGWASHRARVSRLGFFSLFVFGACAVLSVAVEFTQQFFPPRTVSLNDLIAEFAGTAVGIVLWWTTGEKLRDLIESLFAKGDRAAYAGLVLYTVGYLAFSLFPYDFLISAAEIRAKLSGNYFHWLASPGTCGSPLRCGAKLAAEAAAVAPLGLLIGFLSRQSGWPLLRMTAWLGLWLGLVIETLQFFLVSGVTLGASVFTRVIGLTAGATAGENLKRMSLWPLLYLLRPLMPVTGLAYVLLLASLAWAGKGPLLTLEQGLNRIHEVSLMPFYYHYYTTESAAMTSLFGVAIMFLPIGIQYWIWRITQLREFVARGAVNASLLGAVISSALECGKLFLSGARPDPTNVLIGAVSAAGGFLCASVCTRASLRLGVIADEEIPVARTGGAAQRSFRSDDCAQALSYGAARPVRDYEVTQLETKTTWPSRALGIVILSTVIVAVIGFPYARLPLVIGLSVYAGVLYLHPRTWLIALPALLPILDLAPWSGRFFFDEFDFVVLTTVAVMLWRGKMRAATARMPRAIAIAVVLLMLSYSVSAFLGLFPLDPWDANAFANYFSRYNSLRVVKGFVWAILLLYLIPHFSGAPRFAADQKRLLNTGMVLGMIALALAVLYERLIFVGLFNFSSDLRAIATFSGLHNGGNDIEAYLVFAAPFVVTWVFDQRGPRRYLFGVGIFALASYSLLVTFSRGGYLGFLVAWIGLIACLLVLASSRSFALPPLKAPSFVIFLLLLGAGIALPILKGDFIRERFATVALDWQSRLDQLHNTFRMMDANVMTTLFGMGLGRYPATYLARQPAQSNPTVYRFEKEGDRTFIRIKAGSPLYMGQRITTEPHKLYLLSLDVRGSRPNGELTVPICEKQLQRSFRCHWFQFRTAGGGVWEHFEKRFDMGEVGGDVSRVAVSFLRRPVELALYNAGQGNILDITNVELIDETGRNLIINGDFSHAQDRWFFTVDDLLPWQSSNHWAQIAFEQGWGGLLVFNFLLIALFVGLFIRVTQGDLFSAVVGAGVLGFLTVGLFGSLFDTPKMATLFYFVTIFPFRCDGAAERSRKNSTDMAARSTGTSL